MISVQERGKINIKELDVATSSESKVNEFNLARYITVDDWEAMEEIIKNKVSSNNGLGNNLGHMHALNFASNMHLLMHDTPTQQYLFTHDFIKGMGDRFAFNEARYKLLLPDIPADPINTSDENMKRYYTKYLTHPESNTKFDIVVRESIFNLFVLRPDKLNEIKGLDDGYVEKIFERYIQEYNNTEVPDRRLIGAASAFKLFLPEKAHMIDLSRQKWNAMREELDLYRHSKNQYLTFAELAVDMKILAAHKVEMTRKGIKFTMSSPSGFTNNVPLNVPERRRF
jgi:hypothetical protein